jgi:hypothetical protein
MSIANSSQAQVSEEFYGGNLLPHAESLRTSEPANPPLPERLRRCEKIDSVLFHVIPVPIFIAINSSRNAAFSMSYEFTEPRFSPG